MSFSVKHRQYLAFLFLLAIALVVTISSYFRARQEFIQFHRAELLIRSGAMEQGIDLASQALASGYHQSQELARLADFCFTLADQYQSRQQFDQAADYYRAGLLLTPESLIGRLHLADTLSWMHHHSEAIILYRQVLTEHPDLRPARIALARVLGWSGRLDEAINEYRIALGDLP